MVMILQQEIELKKLGLPHWKASATINNKQHLMYASTRRGAYQLLLASIGWKVYNGSESND